MIWTEERISQLKSLWACGLSSSQIADKFGAGISRNAVIGKVYRLKLERRYHSPRGTEAAATKKARKPRKQANLKVFEPKPFVAESFSTAPVQPGDHLAHVEAPSGPHVTLMELKLEHCRWPIGDRPVIYCGAPATKDKAYCPHHCSIAYESVRSRNARIAAEKAWAENPNRNSGYKRRARIA